MKQRWHGYVLRKGGHPPIILMQCGPIRHRAILQKQRQLANVAYRRSRARAKVLVERDEDPLLSVSLFANLFSCPDLARTLQCVYSNKDGLHVFSDSLQS